MDCSNSVYQWNRIEKRPVLILWNDCNDVVLAAVTSAKPRTQTDVVLKNWVNSGLRVESTVRLSRLDCLEKSLMLSKLGKLSAEDAKKLKEIWTTYVKPQFLDIVKREKTMASPAIHAGEILADELPLLR